MGNVMSCFGSGVARTAHEAGHQSAAEERSELFRQGLIRRSLIGALHSVEPGFHEASEVLRDLPDEFCPHKHGHRLELEDGSLAQRSIVAALGQFAHHELSADSLREMMLLGVRPHLLPALGVLLHYRLLDFSVKHEHDVHCGSGLFGHRHCTVMHTMALHGKETEDISTHSSLDERFAVLKQAGVDLDVPCAHGDTPLIWAVRWGSLAAVQALVRAGAKVDHHDSEGYTALHRAAQRGDAATVEFLAQHGHAPDLPIADRHHRTALHLATQGGHKRSISALSRAGANMNALDADFESPLVLAVRGHHLHALRALVRSGANINFRHGPHGYTALHWATRLGSAPMVRALLSLGADVNARARDGSRPLHFIGLNHSEAGYSVAGMKSIADILLASGASLDAADNRGSTAIDVAADQGNQFIFEHFLLRGAIARHPLDLAAASP